MAEKRREPQRTSGGDPTGQQPGDPATKPVVDLLTSILTDARTQIRSRTPKLLEGDAATAVARFREIGATLDLLPTTISLTAKPTQLDQPGDVTLTWSSTEARTVSIEAEDDNGDPRPDLSPGEVSPVEGGSVLVRNVSGTTIFTATAKGPCSDVEAGAKVVVGHGVP